MTPGFPLAGRLAIVTGAGSGIGRAIARAAARRGMPLALADLDGAAAAATLDGIVQAGGDGVAQCVDVRDAAAVAAFADTAIARFGLPGAVFANAGVLKYGSTLRPDLAAWRAALDVNVMGVVHTVHAVLGKMLDGGTPGWLVITGSMGSFVPAPELAAYTASKHALWALAECLRHELAGQDRVGVSLLTPPRIDTPFLAESLARTRERSGEAAAAALRASAMAADEVAEHALEGMATGAFYIAPHYAEVEPIVRRRIAELEASR